MTETGIRIPRMQARPPMMAGSNIQHPGQRVPSVSGNVIVEQTGIPRRKMLNDFPHELLLFFDWQRLELGKQFCCGGTHAEILASFGEDVSRGVHPSL